MSRSQISRDAYEKQGKTFLVWRFRPASERRMHVPVEKFEDVFVVARGSGRSRRPGSLCLSTERRLFQAASGARPARGSPVRRDRQRRQHPAGRLPGPKLRPLTQPRPESANGQRRATGSPRPPGRYRSRRSLQRLARHARFNHSIFTSLPHAGRGHQPGCAGLRLVSGDANVDRRLSRPRSTSRRDHHRGTWSGDRGSGDAGHSADRDCVDGCQWRAGRSQPDRRPDST